MSMRRTLGQAHEVTERLRAAGIADLVVESALAGGETGAYAAVDGSGRECVIKWSTDLVHFDLHAENILVVEGKLSGIVDAEFAATGDGGFDLVVLAICAREMPIGDAVRDRLWQLVEERVDSALVPASVAHVLLRCADWDLRSRGGASSELWLTEADLRLPA